MKTVKVSRCESRLGSIAWQYFGYVNGVAVYQSSKLWRDKSDCARAARQWARKP